MKKTDIEKVRAVAISFAHLPIEPNEEFPVLVSHPYLDSAAAFIPSESGNEMVNVLEGDNEEKFKAALVAKLEQTNVLLRFIMILNKTYRFSFLNHVKDYLSDDDLGAVLRYIWIDSEYKNDGAVFTKRQLVSLFRRSTKGTLMDEEERTALEALPERITVYRGTTSINSKDIKVFTWTLDKETAVWYSQRFDDEIQCVFQAELSKENVLAYFSSDDEIVANPFKLENIVRLS